MQRSGEAAASDEALEEGEIHEVLGNDRRRLAIEALREADGTSSVRELSETIAAQESDEAPAPQNRRQSVYVSLHQTHLPKLDELGVVEYDEDSKTVRLQRKVEELEVYMEVVPEYGLSWGEAYVALSLLGLSTVLAAMVGVPVVASIGLPYLVGGYFLLLLMVSIYHVYSHQDRTVIGRVLR